MHHPWVYFWPQCLDGAFRLNNHVMAIVKNAISVQMVRKIEKKNHLIHIPSLYCNLWEMFGVKADYLHIGEHCDNLKSKVSVWWLIVTSFLLAFGYRILLYPWIPLLLWASSSFDDKYTFYRIHGLILQEHFQVKVLCSP